jgi:hypothetical protein
MLHCAGLIKGWGSCCVHQHAHAAREEEGAGKLHVGKESLFDIAKKKPRLGGAFL